MHHQAYKLALCSHKGGTGRTTASAALAWCFGQLGFEVVLLDAELIPGLTHLVGECDWQNVRFCSTWDDAANGVAADIWIIDSPSLMEPASVPLLECIDGLILTCLADPLSLRTVPAAAGALDQARKKNPNLELLGILLSIYDDADAVQITMLAQLRDRHGELLLEPPVPAQSDLRTWPLFPGRTLPVGAAADAYLAIARSLENWIRAAART